MPRTHSELMSGTTVEDLVDQLIDYANLQGKQTCKHCVCTIQFRTLDATMTQRIGHCIVDQGRPIGDIQPRVATVTGVSS